MSAYDKKIRLYGLADSRRFSLEGDVITRLVLEALQVTPSDRRRVNISPSNAWLDYTALDELWERSAPPSLPSRADALKAAESLLTRLEHKCSGANRAWPDRLRGVNLLPPVGLLRRIGLHAVMRPDGSGWDHWLYRAEPQLALDGGSKTRAGVFGAQVEVRIGHGGQPISVRSRWTPLSSVKKFTDLSPFRPAPVEDDTAANGGASSNSDRYIKYLLQGAGIPQYYLAPYYFYGDDHDLNMASASPFSLTVNIGRTKQAGGRMTLAALARGGSGDYVYNWGTSSMIRIEEGIREIGRGNSQTVNTIDGRAVMSSIDIDNGSYIIWLNVQDRATGAFKHQQQQIFSSPFSSDLEAILA
jgi:hypothetical protein